MNADVITLKQLMGISKKKRCTFQHSGRDFTWWVENESFVRIISEDRRFYVDYLIVDTPPDAGGLLAVLGDEFCGLESDHDRPIVLNVPKSIANCFAQSMGSVVDAILTWALDPKHEIIRYTITKRNYLGIEHVRED